MDGPGCDWDKHWTLENRRSKRAEESGDDKHKKAKEERIEAERRDRKREWKKGEEERVEEGRGRESGRSERKTESGRRERRRNGKREKKRNGKSDIQRSSPLLSKVNKQSRDSPPFLSTEITSMLLSLLSFIFLRFDCFNKVLS